MEPPNINRREKMTNHRSIACFYALQIMADDSSIIHEFYSRKERDDWVSNTPDAYVYESARAKKAMNYGRPTVIEH